MLRPMRKGKGSEQGQNKLNARRNAVTAALKARGSQHMPCNKTTSSTDRNTRSVGQALRGLASNCKRKMYKHGRLFTGTYLQKKKKHSSSNPDSGSVSESDSNVEI